MATELKIRDTRNFRCDLFGCKNQAVKAITTVTAPVAECFMICQEHLDMLINKIVNLSDKPVIGSLVEPQEEAPKEVPEPKRYLTIPKKKTNEELEQEAHEEELKLAEEQARKKEEQKKKTEASKVKHNNVFEKR